MADVDLDAHYYSLQEDILLVIPSPRRRHQLRARNRSSASSLNSSSTEVVASVFTMCDYRGELMALNGASLSGCFRPSMDQAALLEYVIEPRFQFSPPRRRYKSDTTVKTDSGSCGWMCPHMNAKRFFIMVWKRVTRSNSRQRSSEPVFAEIVPFLSPTPTQNHVHHISWESSSECTTRYIVACLDYAESSDDMF
ncbi:hypothetical protein FISHEDRAFT_77052 [Fistulina hepatica ATCC 64428]|uniref:Uncharacterized protein n=1 Tax=Fistulina hepatica ATCC 64428 TaxID=1128425 RepID=A0A0D7A2R8_9AGAR|nr:hypothetical protein FISHEDRAFT_77052 [Fistulina hepatica ATCC 64428]